MMPRMLAGVVLGSALCFSCSSDTISGGTDGAGSDLAIAVVGGDAGVTITADASGNARFLGEIKNSGTKTGCFINLSVDALDANGDPLAGQSSAFGFLFGETFQYTQFYQFGPATYNHCLSAGATGSFDLRTTIPESDVTRVTVHPSCQGDEAVACLPPGNGLFLRPIPILTLLNGVITETTDGSGHREYTGTIMNNRPLNEVTSVAKNLRIVFTAKNASGQVVDVACMNQDGTPCTPLSSSSTVLGPQETWNFEVALSIDPSQTCAGCFYYYLNYGT